MENHIYTEKDWKLFRCKIGEWQEAYIARLNLEYIELLSREGSAADNFWELEKRIREDKKHPGVIVDMRRSTFVYHLIDLLADDVITYDDLDGFNDNLKDTVCQLAKRQKEIYSGDDETDSTK